MQPPNNLQHTAHKHYSSAWPPERARDHADNTHQEASIWKPHFFCYYQIKKTSYKGTTVLSLSSNKQPIQKNASYQEAILISFPLCLEFIFKLLGFYKDVISLKLAHQSVVGGCLFIFRLPRLELITQKLYYLQYCLANSLSIFLVKS